MAPKNVTNTAVLDEVAEVETPKGDATVISPPDESTATRLREQESIIIGDIQSFVQRTAEVQQRVGRALNVIRANDLWKAGRDGSGGTFKSFSAYLTHLADGVGYSRTNFLRMQKDDAVAYLESGDAPEGWEAPVSRGGASGVKYTTIDKAADITLRQIDGLFERWAERAGLVRMDVDGEKVPDGTLDTLRIEAEEAFANVRAQLVTLSAIE
jgi:hypothetical protein